MALNFPNSPSVNDRYTVGSTTWIWDGTVWNAQNGAIDFTTYVETFNGQTGDVQGVSSINGSTGDVTGILRETNHIGTIRIKDDLGAILIPPNNTVVQTISNTALFGKTGSYILLIHPYTFLQGCTLSEIQTSQGGSVSGHTGSLLFAVYDTHPSNGRPLNKLYESAEINIGTLNYARYSANPDLYVEPGSYWIGFLMKNPSGKAATTWSWSVQTGSATVWEVDGVSGVTRYFNTGNMNHLRYSFAGMTLPDVLTHGFTAAVTVNTDPAIGWGASETYQGSRCPHIGVAIE
jgi:hypothetical protein